METSEEVQWGALNYMVAEANYGGRVTDDKDRRLIKTILETYYCPEILNEEYKFSESGFYYSPKEGELSSYREYISKLPMNDAPEVFGMHENAEISGAILGTGQLCGTILSLLPRSS